jgi:hypothetical protein
MMPDLYIYYMFSYYLHTAGIEQLDELKDMLRKDWNINSETRNSIQVA